MMFTGELLKDARVVLSDISGTLGGPDGGKSWGGTFFMPPRNVLPAGMYLLQMDCGPSGTVQLSTVASNLDTSAVVTFRGVGLLG
jgi:hypothetical protein